MSTTPPNSKARFLWTQTEKLARELGGIPIFFTYVHQVLLRYKERKKKIKSTELLKFYKCGQYPPGDTTFFM